MKTVVTLGLLAALACGPALAGDKEMIQALDDQWSATANRGDAAGLAAMYPPDATLLPPGSDPVPRSAAQGLFEAFLKNTARITLTAKDVVRLSPDYIREIGTYTAQNRAQPPATQTQTYVVVWKRVGGQWMLWTDIFH